MLGRCVLTTLPLLKVSLLAHTVGAHINKVHQVPKCIMSLDITKAGGRMYAIILDIHHGY